MKNLYCRFKKSTEHRSDSNTKHMSILLVGKDSSDLVAKDDNFINVKNRGDLWNVSAGVFEIFLIVEKYFSVIFQTRKEKLMFNKLFLHW